MKKLFLPSDVTELYRSPKGKYAFVDFFSGYFARLGVKDKIDNNELNIIADFHFYNMEFAKERLLLADDKTALLLNVFAMLIAFKDFEASSASIKSRGADERPKEDAGTVNVQLPPNSEEEDYRIALEQKYDAFRDALMSFGVDNPPCSLRVFTADELRKILDYALGTYFSHFRLYSYVLSNKQLSDQKSIVVYIDEPLPIPPLSEGLQGNTEREEIESQHDEEPTQTPAPEQKQPVPGAEPAEKTESLPEAKREASIKPVQAPAAVPVSTLPKESEAALNSGVQSFKNEIRTLIEHRDVELDKMVEGVIKGKK